MISIFENSASCLAYGWSEEDGKRKRLNEEEGRGGGGVCKEDYEGPAMRGLLLESEKVLRKSGTHSGNKLETWASLMENRKL